MDFSAYAEPIDSGVSHCRFADHTYVIARKHPLEDVNCPCYGRPRPGQTQVLFPPIQDGDMHLVSAMINGDYTVKQCYDGNNDNCGLIYGLQGVCHQMANRILSTASQPGPCVVMGSNGSFVKGLRLSTNIYGNYGRCGQTFAQRLYDISTATDHLDAGADALSDHSYHDFVQSLLHKVNAANFSKETKEILREEITGDSTPASRLAIMCKYSLPNKISDADIKKLEEALSVYTDLLDHKAKELEADTEITNGRGITRMLMDVEPFVNGGFQQFNAAAFSILGSENYEALYKQKYEADFVLCSAEESSPAAEG